MKINISCYGNKTLGEAIHTRLVELGYTPDCNVSKSLAIDNCFALMPENKRYHYNIDTSTGKGSLDDLFFTEKYRVKTPIKVKLNDRYTAEVANVINVGCKTFPTSIVKELSEALKKYNS